MSSSIHCEPPVSLEQSYRVCARTSRQRFGQFHWAISNLPNDRRRHLYAIFAFLAESLDLLNSHVSPVVRKSNWIKLRDDLRDALRGNPNPAPAHAALVHTTTHCRIPAEYWFDVLAGVEMGIRIAQFEAFDQWLQFGCRVGGSICLASVETLGTRSAGYQDAAIACGQSIHLTLLLASVGSEIQTTLQYFPRIDAQACEMDLAALDPAHPGPEFERLVRLQVERVESLFEQAARLTDYLQLDGQRVIRSVLSTFWRLLMQIKCEPALIVGSRSQLPRSELFKLKVRHWLGIEGDAAVLRKQRNAAHH